MHGTFTVGNRTIMRFEEVVVRRTKKWKDANGKPKQKTRRFTQTINPFNRTLHGEPKTRQQILKELNTQADLWKLQEPGKETV